MLRGNKAMLANGLSLLCQMKKETDGIGLVTCTSIVIQICLFLKFVTALFALQKLPFQILPGYSNQKGITSISQSILAVPWNSLL